MTSKPTWVAETLTPDWSALPKRPSSQEIAPGVLLHAGGSNNYVLHTSAGLLVIDPGHQRLKDSFYDSVRAWSSAPVHTVALTHGHIDHATGFGRFLDEDAHPQVIAQEACVGRFARYRLTHGFNEHINARQTANPDYVFPTEFLDPTLTFRDRMVEQIGDLTVEFHAMRGETDDDCTIWIPEHQMLFVGDKATWKVPNSGNPLKTQRYPLEWATNLETMAAYGAEWLCPGHDLVLHGADLVRTFLLDQARFLRSIIDQVLDRMNAGQSVDEIVHAVSPDPELARLPYIRSVYNHPQFIVRDILRSLGGWWDGEGPTLLPARLEEQAAEIVRLAGGIDPVLSRAQTLVEEDDMALACHLVDWATNAAPDSLPAQELKRDVYRKRADREEHGMPAGFFLAEVLDAERAIAGLQGATP